mmetsp:Transcript_57130/g.125018  ORF Transcript_57130/g.125018 Transcript_57130/m.125018 type:complete len:352 (+) Transcript_57130:204-1259(+)
MIVVGTVARAEVAAPVASIRLRDAAQVSAHTDDDEPLLLLATLGVSGRVAHGRSDGIVLLGAGNHLGSSSADEDGLGSPLHDEVLTLANWAEVDLDNTGSPDVLGGPETVEELGADDADQGGEDDAGGGGHEVDPGTAVGMVQGQSIGAEVEVALRHGGIRHGGVLSPADRSVILRGVLGDGDNRRLLGVGPDISSHQVCTCSQFALRHVGLARESWLPNGIVVDVPVLADAVSLMGIAGVGADEVLGVVDNGELGGLGQLLRVLSRGLEDELVQVQGLLRGRSVEVGVDQVHIDGLSQAGRGSRHSSAEGRLALACGQPREHLEVRGCRGGGGTRLRGSLGGIYSLSLQA